MCNGKANLTKHAKPFREQRNPAFCAGQPGCLFKRLCQQQPILSCGFSEDGCMLGQEKGCGNARDWMAKRHQVWETSISELGRGSSVYHVKRL